MGTAKRSLSEGTGGDRRTGASGLLFLMSFGDSEGIFVQSVASLAPGSFFSGSSHNVMCERTSLGSTLRVVLISSSMRLFRLLSWPLYRFMDSTEKRSDFPCTLKEVAGLFAFTGVITRPLFFSMLYAGSPPKDRDARLDAKGMFRMRTLRTAPVLSALQEKRGSPRRRPESVLEGASVICFSIFSGFAGQMKVSGMVMPCLPSEDGSIQTRSLPMFTAWGCVV